MENDSRALHLLGCLKNDRYTCFLSHPQSSSLYPHARSSPHPWPKIQKLKWKRPHCIAFRCRQNFPSSERFNSMMSPSPLHLGLAILFRENLYKQHWYFHFSIEYSWFLSQIQSHQGLVSGAEVRLRVCGQVSLKGPSHPSFQLESNLPANLKINKKDREDGKGECEYIGKLQEKRGNNNIK